MGAALCLSGCIVSPPEPPAPVRWIGGSNYNWYRVDGCNRDPYGVVAQYHIDKPTIDAQLADMYANGQRRLRLMIYHWDGHTFQNGVSVAYNGPASGTLLDAPSGELSQQSQDNLANLLASIKSHGFEEVEVAMGPQGANNVGTWPQWEEEYYEQNWKALVRVRSIVVASGMGYRLDLMNEGIPSKAWAFYANQLRYTQRMWKRYVEEFGIDDTVGFSMVPTVDVASEVPNVYGLNPYPPAYDLHFYDDAYASFSAVFKELNAQPVRAPWIIGEAYHNDSHEAEGLRKAIEHTGQRVRFLMQWPAVGNGNPCGASEVNVAPPSSFDAYQSAGF